MLVKRRVKWFVNLYITRLSGFGKVGRLAFLRVSSRGKGLFVDRWPEVVVSTESRVVEVASEAKDTLDGSKRQWGLVRNGRAVWDDFWWFWGGFRFLMTFLDFWKFAVVGNITKKIGTQVSCECGWRR